MNFHYLPEPTPFNPEAVIQVILLTGIILCLAGIAWLIRQIAITEMETKRINQKLEKRNTL